MVNTLLMIVREIQTAELRLKRGDERRRPLAEAPSTLVGSMGALPTAGAGFAHPHVRSTSVGLDGWMGAGGLKGWSGDEGTGKGSESGGGGSPASEEQRLHYTRNARAVQHYNVTRLVFHHQKNVISL